MIKAVSAAWGAEADDELPERSRKRRQGTAAQKSPEEYMPADLANPKEGGKVRPIYGEQEAAQLPINIGYTIID